jgi:hypothetical protein
VVEVPQVPKTRIEVMLYAYGDAGTEPIDGRLIEVPNAVTRREPRDPGVP